MFLGVRKLTGTILLALTFISSPAWAGWQLNLHQGVTSISQDIYHLHMIILGICCVIGVVVFGVMFYAIIFHRKSRGAKASEFHESVTVEIAWTIIPFVILIAMAIPATKVLIKMYDTDDADVTIKATGYQWKWGYEYLDEGISFMSNLSTPQDQIHNVSVKEDHYMLEVDNEVVIPVGKKIRFLTTSNDVIHSWYVPEFGVKKDAIPGFINETWARVDKPGIYRGQCTELCGALHGFMPIVVRAVSEDEYAQWVAEHQDKAKAKQAAAEKQYSKDELMAKGEATYNKICAACHQVNGMGIPGVFAALKGSAIATGDIADHINIVLHGKNGTAMQAFAGQLDDLEIASVITYERNAWGNDTGDVIQPQQIKAAR